MMLTTALTVLAHAGGWDEFLVFAGPILLVYVVLRWWDRRGGSADADPHTSARSDSEPADEGAGVVDGLEGTR
ncbi:MAG: hypothetical protein ACRDUY_01750 [Nitriliruptorales bacterium]